MQLFVIDADLTNNQARAVERLLHDVVATWQPKAESLAWDIEPEGMTIVEDRGNEILGMIDGEEYVLRFVDQAERDLYDAAVMLKRKRENQRKVEEAGL